MSIRHLILLFFCILGLSACTASVARAPVSDLTLGNSRLYKAPTKQGPIKTKSYLVQKGDTLYSIGWRSDISVNALITYNNLKKPYIIKPGQILQLQNNKIQPVKKVVAKSEQPSQNVNKNSASACVAQHCQKKKTKKLDPPKTKAYSNVKATEKIAKKDNIIIKNEKVSDWAWPVKGKLTKKFSTSPSGKQGISLVNSQGTSIHAAASGQVVYAGSGLRGYGNLIIIKHNYDYLSAYAHNETLLVQESDSIKKGQKIAIMGESGSDHVHLHFEIRFRGKSVDPLRYLPKR